MKNIRTAVWMNESEAVRYQSDVLYAMISIKTPNSTSVRFRRDSKRFAIMSMEFNDVNMDVKYLDVLDEVKAVLVPFSAAHAETVYDFYEEADKAGCQHMAVHCEAGVSRSPSIAIALARVYHVELLKPAPFRIPNRLVYRTMLEVAQRRHLYEPGFRFDPSNGV